MVIARFLFWLFCLSLFACQSAVPLLAGHNLKYSARMLALACWLTDNFFYGSALIARYFLVKI
ncbi:MAG TPA: hypothetical protein PL191_01510 [Candidatus Saccharimonas sp.]|nr:hypothetical protein [Candidatus Saccharimonas sp.]